VLLAGSYETGAGFGASVLVFFYDFEVGILKFL
jgi:hypothetical protein